MSATLIMFSPKCAHCGEDLPRSANFCVTCGKPFHISDEDNRPPAEIRPIRPINDSVRLPAPPKTSSLSPISDSALSQDRAADSWSDEAPLRQGALNESAVSMDQSAVSVDINNTSIDQSAVSMDQSAVSMDINNTSMDFEGTLLPTERSKRPWIYAGAAAAFLLLLISWPSSEKAPHPLLTPQEPEFIEEAASAPSAPLPASMAVAPLPQEAPKTPATKTPAVKTPATKTPTAAAPKVESKVEPKAPKAEPTGPGLLGALKAQEANETAAPKPEPTPKPDATNNAANEAASFLDED